ncbi:hypothetical protein ACP4OV_022313 [Aristida adscensionis]
MAQLLHHQEPAFYGKEFHGCRFSILQFFGFRRRLRSTKMLSDKKHDQGKSSSGSRRRSSYAPLKDEDSGIINDEKNIEVNKKQKAPKRNSGKASLRSLILRKLYGKEGQKEKMLPVAPKLLRTISIHYLENNEYVLDGRATSSGDGSSHSTTLSMQNATNTNPHHAISSIPDGSDIDTSSSFLLKSGDSHVKKKSHRSISMDGVLHKVPYGMKMSGDVISEGLPRSASATYDRDGLKPYTAIGPKRHANQGFRRSHSLTESLESYSRLLDSIASSESKRILTNSKSTRNHSLDGSIIMSSFQGVSTSEFSSQSLVSHDENLVTPENSLSSIVPEKNDVDGDVKVAVDESSRYEAAGGSENPVLLEDHINSKKCDVVEVSAEADSYTASSSLEVNDIAEEHETTFHDNDQVPELGSVCSMPEVDIPGEHAETCDDDPVHSSIEADSCTALPSKDDISEEHPATSCNSQFHSFHISEPTEGTFCVPDPSPEFEADTYLSCEQETESPMSVLDVTFSDDPTSLVKHTPLDDTPLKPRILHLGDANISTGVDVVKESDFDDLNSLQVDPAHEAEFNYVRDIFKKSSFSNETLFDEWYSQNIAALQEEDCQHYEAAAAAFDFTDMSADQLLLFDLTNEALLEIYKKYSVCKKLSWSPSFDRPKPVGHLILKELWSKMSCRLDEQPQSPIEVDTILSSDLVKSDRWINFQRDADHLGNKLADFVFEKLVTELILQLADF